MNVEAVDVGGDRAIGERLGRCAAGNLVQRPLPGSIAEHELEPFLDRCHREAGCENRAGWYGRKLDDRGMFVLGRPPGDGTPARKGVPVTGVRVGEALSQYHEFQRLTNMNETGLILFSTDHCALCDEALGLLLSMPELAGTSLRVVDVADDDDLISTYGPRLPVLGFAGRELDWPFGATDVLRWIRKLEQT